MRTLILALILSGCVQAPSPRPNIILITLDTFRADLLTAYGADDALTPALNRFAAEAVVFENAVTPIGTTFPAHASLFTGLYPRQHGVRWNGDALDQSFATLAERLRDAGYRTAAFVSLSSLLERGGLGQGFDVHSRPAARRVPRVLDAEQVNASGLAWLAEEADEPFFVWFHYFETHSPYRLTSHARETFTRRGYRGPLAGGASTEVFYSLGDSLPWSDGERSAVRTLYEGEAAHLDGVLAELLEALRRSQILDRSLVVITADHGQALGEHDLVGHGFLLWQPVVAVPLLIRQPGDADPRRVEERVGIIDLPATITDLLDLPQSSDSGRSLLPALEGAALPSRPYFVETRTGTETQPWTRDESPAVAILAGQFKAIRWPGQWMWLNLKADPDELEGARFSVPPIERARLEGLLEGFDSQPGFRSERKLLTPEAQRELRSLGYLE